MTIELLTMAERIRLLREGAGLTQAEVGRMLGISRAGVNAWEMGLSIPSAKNVVELAKKFGVSTDYLFGLDTAPTISVRGLTQNQVTAILGIVECFREHNGHGADPASRSRSGTES